MVEPLILNALIKIKHHCVKINLQSSTEAYQPITFSNHCHVWGIDTLAKILCIMHASGMADTTN